VIRLRPGPADPASVTIVPANEASWENLQAIFGVRGYPAYCQCQFFKIGHVQWTAPTPRSPGRHSGGS
jgi:hypothetical protein